MTQEATRTPYHHGNLRAELLDAAARAVDEGGLDGLSLRALARETGVSHAAPARHFPDREALLDALAIHGFEQLAALLDEAAGNDKESFDTRLEKVATSYIAFALEHGPLLELMYRSKHQEGADAIVEAGERAFERPIELIARAQDAGEIVSGDPNVIASIAFATIHGLASLAGSGMIEPDFLKDAVPLAITQMRDGLRPR
ncbi:MAG: TetR/AcrR family transcriptional regulator [Solirubrobacterales bacterium]